MAISIAYGQPVRGFHENSFLLETIWQYKAEGDNFSYKSWRVGKTGAQQLPTSVQKELSAPYASSPDYLILMFSEFRSLPDTSPLFFPACFTVVDLFSAQILNDPVSVPLDCEPVIQLAGNSVEQKQIERAYCRLPITQSEQGLTLGITGGHFDSECTIELQKRKREEKASGRVALLTYSRNIETSDSPGVSIFDPINSENRTSGYGGWNAPSDDRKPKPPAIIIPDLELSIVLPGLFYPEVELEVENGLSQPQYSVDFSQTNVVIHFGFGDDIESLTLSLEQWQLLVEYKAHSSPFLLYYLMRKLRRGQGHLEELAEELQLWLDRQDMLQSEKFDKAEMEPVESMITNLLDELEAIPPEEITLVAGLAVFYESYLEQQIGWEPEHQSRVSEEYLRALRDTVMLLSRTKQLADEINQRWSQSGNKLVFMPLSNLSLNGLRELLRAQEKMLWLELLKYTLNSHERINNNGILELAREKKEKPVLSSSSSSGNNPASDEISNRNPTQQIQGKSGNSFRTDQSVLKYNQTVVDTTTKTKSTSPVPTSLSGFRRWLQYSLFAGCFYWSLCMRLRIDESLEEKLQWFVRFQQGEQNRGQNDLLQYLGNLPFLHSLCHFPIQESCHLPIQESCHFPIQESCHKDDKTAQASNNLSLLYPSCCISGQGSRHENDKRVRIRSKNVFLYPSCHVPVQESGHKDNKMVQTLVEELIKETLIKVLLILLNDNWDDVLTLIKSVWDLKSTLDYGNKFIVPVEPVSIMNWLDRHSYNDMLDLIAYTFLYSIHSRLSSDSNTDHLPYWYFQLLEKRIPVPRLLLNPKGLSQNEIVAIIPTAENNTKPLMYTCLCDNWFEICKELYTERKNHHITIELLRKRLKISCSYHEHQCSIILFNWLNALMISEKGGGTHTLSEEEKEMTECQKNKDADTKTISKEWNNYLASIQKDLKDFEALVEEEGDVFSDEQAFKEEEEVYPVEDTIHLQPARMVTSKMKMPQKKRHNCTTCDLINKTITSMLSQIRLNELLVKPGSVMETWYVASSPGEKDGFSYDKISINNDTDRSARIWLLKQLIHIFFEQGLFKEATQWLAKMLQENPLLKVETPAKLEQYLFTELEHIRRTWKSNDWTAIDNLLQWNLYTSYLHLPLWLSKKASDLNWIIGETLFQCDLLEEAFPFVSVAAKHNSSALNLMLRLGCLFTIAKSECMKREGVAIPGSGLVGGEQLLKQYVDGNLYPASGIELELVLAIKYHRSRQLSGCFKPVAGNACGQGSVSWLYSQPAESEQASQTKLFLALGDPCCVNFCNIMEDIILDPLALMPVLKRLKQSFRRRVNIKKLIKALKSGSQDSVRQNLRLFGPFGFVSQLVNTDGADFRDLALLYFLEYLAASMDSTSEQTPLQPDDTITEESVTKVLAENKRQVFTTESEVATELVRQLESTPICAYVQGLALLVLGSPEKAVEKLSESSESAVVKKSKSLNSAEKKAERKEASLKCMSDRRGCHCPLCTDKKTQRKQKSRKGQHIGALRNKVAAKKNKESTIVRQPFYEITKKNVGENAASYQECYESMISQINIDWLRHMIILIYLPFSLNEESRTRMQGVLATSSSHTEFLLGVLKLREANYTAALDLLRLSRSSLGQHLAGQIYLSGIARKGKKDFERALKHFRLFVNDIIFAPSIAQLYAFSDAEALQLRRRFSFIRDDEVQLLKNWYDESDQSLFALTAQENVVSGSKNPRVHFRLSQIYHDQGVIYPKYHCKLIKRFIQTIKPEDSIYFIADPYRDQFIKYANNCTENPLLASDIEALKKLFFFLPLIAPEDAKRHSARERLFIALALIDKIPYPYNGQCRKQIFIHVKDGNKEQHWRLLLSNAKQEKMGSWGLEKHLAYELMSESSDSQIIKTLLKLNRICKNGLVEAMTASDYTSILARLTHASETVPWGNEFYTNLKILKDRSESKPDYSGSIAMAVINFLDSNNNKNYIEILSWLDWLTMTWEERQSYYRKVIFRHIRQPLDDFLLEKILDEFILLEPDNHHILDMVDRLVSFLIHSISSRDEARIDRLVEIISYLQVDALKGERAVIISEFLQDITFSGESIKPWAGNLYKMLRGSREKMESKVLETAILRLMPYLRLPQQQNNAAALDWLNMAFKQQGVNKCALINQLTTDVFDWPWPDHDWLSQLYRIYPADCNQPSHAMEQVISRQLLRWLESNYKQPQTHLLLTSYLEVPGGKPENLWKDLEQASAVGKAMAYLLSIEEEKKQILPFLTENMPESALQELMNQVVRKPDPQLIQHIISNPSIVARLSQDRLLELALQATPAWVSETKTILLQALEHDFLKQQDSASILNLLRIAPESFKSTLYSVLLDDHVENLKLLELEKNQDILNVLINKTEFRRVHYYAFLATLKERSREIQEQTYLKLFEQVETYWLAHHCPENFHELIKKWMADVRTVTYRKLSLYHAFLSIVPSLHDLKDIYKFSDYFNIVTKVPDISLSLIIEPLKIISQVLPAEHRLEETTFFPLVQLCRERINLDDASVEEIGQCFEWSLRALRPSKAPEMMEKLSEYAFILAFREELVQLVSTSQKISDMNNLVRNEREQKTIQQNQLWRRIIVSARLKSLIEAANNDTRIQITEALSAATDSWHSLLLRTWVNDKNNAFAQKLKPQKLYTWFRNENVREQLKPSDIAALHSKLGHLERIEQECSQLADWMIERPSSLLAEMLISAAQDVQINKLPKPVREELKKKMDGAVDAWLSTVSPEIPMETKASSLSLVPDSLTGAGSSKYDWKATANQSVLSVLKAVMDNEKLKQCINEGSVDKMRYFLVNHYTVKLNELVQVPVRKGMDAALLEETEAEIQRYLTNAQTNGANQVLTTSLLLRLAIAMKNGDEASVEILVAHAETLVDIPLNLPEANIQPILEALQRFIVHTDKVGSPGLKGYFAGLTKALDYYAVTDDKYRPKHQMKAYELLGTLFSKEDERKATFYWRKALSLGSPKAARKLNLDPSILTMLNFIKNFLREEIVRLDKVRYERLSGYVEALKSIPNPELYPELARTLREWDIYEESRIKEGDATEQNINAEADAGL